ncbi:MAG: histidine phosphatase family protein [Myxococcota bacterium]
MKTVHLVRHGQSETNIRRPRVVGGKNSWAELTPHGVAQSIALGRRLQREGFICDQVASSTAVRAQQTARHCLEQTDVGPDRTYTFKELEELDQGQWAGHLYEEVYTPAQIEIIAAQQWSFRPPGGESQEDVFKRTERWLTQHVVHSKYDHTWVFCHGLVIKLTLTGLLGRDRKVGQRDARCRFDEPRSTHRSHK